MKIIALAALLCACAWAQSPLPSSTPPRKLQVHPEKARFLETVRLSPPDWTKFKIECLECMLLCEGEAGDKSPFSCQRSLPCLEALIDPASAPRIECRTCVPLASSSSASYEGFHLAGRVALSSPLQARATNMSDTSGSGSTKGQLALCSSPPASTPKAEAGPLQPCVYCAKYCADPTNGVLFYTVCIVAKCRLTPGSLSLVLASHVDDFSGARDLLSHSVRNPGPIYQSQWEKSLQRDDTWLKKPRLEDFLSPEPQAQMEHEVEMCELLNQAPHPNLALYYGCLVEADKVQGLSVKNFQSPLLGEVNPKGLSKVHLMGTIRDLVNEGMRGWIQQLRSAVSHIHALGYVHNGITPSNIMLDEDGRPVLIDFGGVCRVGESLTTVRQTIGWHDESVVFAKERNDLDALDEIETWLFGQSHELIFSG
ncbi:hypothetical protein PWT90_11034 [Aphanocladium album]|nr:hypothetical protein PWT90_11034 [Aphanocladium album]